jgi:hypothetical protein
MGMAVRKFLVWLRLSFYWCVMALMTGAVVPVVNSQTLQAHNDIISGDYYIPTAGDDPNPEGFIWAQEANNLIGTAALYGAGFWGSNSTIANVEGGQAWTQQEVFQQRIDGIPVQWMPGITITVSPKTFDNNSSPPSDDDPYDGHATAVAAMMTGVGISPDGGLTVLGTGIAPLAAIQSGGIATEWEYEEVNGQMVRTGAFEMTKQSFVTPYLKYFSTDKVDVINSSWGYTDTSGRTEIYAGIIDGLAHDNPTVAFVASAGNSGADAAPGGPASGFNGISVGALDYNANHAYDYPADFSSGAPLDFYNPVTGTTVSGVRAGVDIAAPGTGLVLAAYDPASPKETGLYYVNAAGTSFAAPMVSGGIALLKDMAKTLMPDNANAMDTRVIKAVIMAGATKTVGWNNGQHQVGAVTVTTQSLDYQVGAGLINLDRSSAIYLNPVLNGARGNLAISGGWDMVAVNYGADQAMSYTFLFSDSAVELTISLNWFSNTVYDDTVEAGYRDIWLSNLDLGLYRIEGDAWTLIAESAGIYNNTEFLRLDLDSGEYGFKVINNGTIFDATNSGLDGQTETYAVAWSAAAIPEPATWAYLLLGTALTVILSWRGKRRRSTWRCQDFPVRRGQGNVFQFGKRQP